ncbi:MAG: hypothetical protein ACR2IQ_01315 [Minisyncoccia bacterium]
MLDEEMLFEEDLDEFGNPITKKQTSRVAAFLSDDEEEDDIENIPIETEESPEDFEGLSEGEEETTGDY